MVTKAPTRPVRKLAERGEILGDEIIGFTASNGRCGTSYIREMLEVTKQCYSAHEFIVRGMLPGVTIEFSNATKEGIKNAEKRWQRGSIPQLNAYRDKPFIESDGRFILTAYYFALRDIRHDRLRIIMLSRNMARIALASYIRGTFRNKGMTNCVAGAMAHPFGAANVTLLPKSIDEMTIMEMVVWGVFETEERKKRFKLVFPDIKTFDWNMDVDPPIRDRWEELLDFLGLKMTKELADKITENPIINSTFQKCPQHIHKLEEAERAVADHKIIFNQNPRPEGFL